MRICLPVSPHYYPDWYPFVLLGYFIQALLLGKGFVSGHNITNTYLNLDIFPQQRSEQRVRLRQVVLVPRN